jgi:tRNA pseudouridine55 synthase
MIYMDGALIIDKPAGMTSHDVVARVRKIIGEKRVGHTGTLDPFATGVLVVLIGRATRLAQFLSGAEKEYQAVICLGFATDTGDMTGLPLQRSFTTEAQRPSEVHREEIETALGSLCGEIEQTPPMYSAKKIAGKKLYEHARRGEEVERQPVRITVREFEAVPRDGELLKQNDDGTCDLAVRVVCSAGTYVRTLAESFGKRLGVGAHLAELRRTRAGQFKIADAITLDRLGEVAQAGSTPEVLISPDAVLVHLPVLKLSAHDELRVCDGIDLQIEAPVADDWSAGQPVRMRNSRGQLIAVGIYDRTRELVHPDVVIAR